MIKLYSLLPLFFVFVSAGTSWAMFKDTTDTVPVARLIENVSKYIQEHPDDAHGYYTLGRIHSFAFAKMECMKMRLYEDEEETKRLDLPRFAPWASLLAAKAEESSISDKQIHHLTQSILFYYKAAARNPNSALYYLGLGWMMEQALPYAEKIGVPPYVVPWVDSRMQDSSLLHLVRDVIDKNRDITTERMFRWYKHEHFNAFKGAWDSADETVRQRLKPYLNRLWKEECLWAYRRAFSNGIHDQIRRQMMDLNNRDNQPSIEAGEGILRILGEEAEESLYSWEIDAIKKALESAKKGMSFITPIVFSLERSATGLDALLDSETVVSFDLDGDGAASNWPWVKAETAILVWDPEEEGEITSGKQLFGSVTWWMFWRNGYEALNALDNNRDGWLREDELHGLAVWRDRNQNGKSEPGEVVPIGVTEIQALAVRPEVCQEKRIEHSQGLILENGERLPTFDWVPERID